MTRARIGKVESVSPFSLPDGTRKLTIDGVEYFSKMEGFSVTPGADVEFKASGKLAIITAVQVPLLEIRTAGVELFAALERGE